MKDILIYALEVTVCSGLFMAFYHTVIHQRTSFRVARIFLTTSLVAAAVIPAFDIPVWKTAALKISALTRYDPQISQNNHIEAAQTPPIDYWQIALWIAYGLVVAVFLIIMICQVAKIRRIKHDSTLYSTNGYNIAISNEVKSPFSFLSTVYLEQGTHPEEIQQILLHETSHIRHHHSVEKIIIEIIKTLMWFNPFAWIVARLLNEVHEFEADNDVLQGGCRVEEYLPVIFKQVFGYAPKISTGMGNSLTKKRFEMMTKKLKHRKYSWLRTVAVLPVAAGMLMLFGFTQKNPKVILRDNEISVQSDSTNRLQLQGASPNSTLFVWVSGSNPYELPLNEINSIDPKLIESISVLKNDSYPDEIKVAMGDRSFDGVIVIELKKSDSNGVVVIGKPDSKKKEKSTKLGKDSFIWLVNEKQEVKIEKIDPDTIESISVLKNDSYPDEVREAMGDRSFDEVVLIEIKK